MADGFLQWANTTQDVRIGRVFDPSVVPPFRYDHEQAFLIAHLPPGLTEGDFPGLMIEYGGEGPLGDGPGTKDFTVLCGIWCVPEPSTVTLLSIVLGFATVCWWRRQQSS